MLPALGIRMACVNNMECPGLDRLTEQFEKLQEKITTIAEAIVGNPVDKNRPGFLIRIDRLERTNQFMRRILYLLSSGLIAVIAAMVKEWLNV
jgi:hypothetical protein